MNMLGVPKYTVNTLYVLGFLIPSCSRVRGLVCSTGAAAAGVADGDAMGEEPGETVALAPPGAEDPPGPSGGVEDLSGSVAGTACEPEVDAVGAESAGAGCDVEPLCADIDVLGSSDGGAEAAGGVVLRDWSAGEEAGAQVDCPADTSAGADPAGDRRGKRGGCAPDPMPVLYSSPACNKKSISAPKLLEFSPLDT
jgi:hypothetical protein